MALLSNILNTLFKGFRGNPLGTALHANKSYSTPSTSSSHSTTSSSSATPTQVMDLEKVLDEKLKQTPGQNLNWRQSIVDFMKLLGMPCGLDSRKELAKDMGYTGDFNDTATMNIWLRDQMFLKIAQNGGKVPPELIKESAA